MRGWILYKYTLDEMPEHVYEIPRFIEEAENQGIEIHIVKPEQFDLVVTRDDRKSVLLDGKTTPLPDFLIPRMGAGTTYLALAVIRHLERLGVTVINGSHAIDTVRDKLYTQQILAASNLPVPKTMVGKFPVDVDMVQKQIGFPVVIKTISGSKGAGVYLSDSPGEFEDITTFIDSSKPNANIIFQEFIASSRGRDLRVIIIGGRAVSCMQRASTDGNFKANVSRGGSATAYELTPEIELLAIEAARIFNLDVAGVDLLFDGDHFKICEINSAPQFKGMETSHPGLSIAREIYTYTRIRLGQFDDLMTHQQPAAPTEPATE